MADALLKTDTIAAIATAAVPQQGSVSIVRVSGTKAVAIAKRLFRAPGHQTWDTHRILYGHIHHPDTEEVVDEALLMLMLAPRSYTRDDVIEFHCHGGMVVVQQVLTLCIELGARLAEPGEFTLRAFLNGRIDLTQAEGISDLVGARSPQAAQAALAGVQGKLAHPIRQLRSQCMNILAEVEARIDFEDDLPPLNEQAIEQNIQQVTDAMAHILDTAHQGELLRTGLKVAIVGRPNVGKSSLLNAWSRSDRAIVTDLPGTTRDVVESYLVVGGIPVQVLDTAGIRNTADEVEQLGVERSRKVSLEADLVLLTIDAQAGWTSSDDAIYQQVKHQPLIIVLNKIDLLEHTPEIPFLETTQHLRVITSAAQHKGIEALENAILNSIQQKRITAANLDVAINQRQSSALKRAYQSIKHVQATIHQRLPLDFWSIDLRAAIQALGEITGEEVTESVLDKIFSQFCIGK
ncbi:MAG: tRNA uridine-5-carboxymethylaminomethyl(34) synthesis GTPase MnmE [Cyanobacteria bacterium J06627_8]